MGTPCSLTTLGVSSPAPFRPPSSRPRPIAPPSFSTGPSVVFALGKRLFLTGGPGTFALTIRLSGAPGGSTSRACAPHSLMRPTLPICYPSEAYMAPITSSSTIRTGYGPQIAAARYVSRSPRLYCISSLLAPSRRPYGTASRVQAPRHRLPFQISFALDLFPRPPLLRTACASSTRSGVFAIGVAMVIRTRSLSSLRR
jgi:hypothetical protein